MSATGPSILLHRNLVFVTGKGGVGKTTVAAALGMAAAAAGRRVVVAEVGDQHRLPAMLGADYDRAGREVEVRPGLWSTSIQPDAALREWLARQLGSRTLVQALTRSNLFSHFVAAAPGARELVTVTKLWELAQSRRWDKKAKGFDLVVADLPASGHGVGLLRTARTFAELTRVGPIATQAGRVRDAIEDPSCTALVAVAQAAELPVSETLELEDRVQADLRRPVDRIVVNAVLPRRWTGADLDALAAADGAVPDPVSRAVRFEAGRATEQASQLARLRRGARAQVLTLPFVMEPVIGEREVGGLGLRLSRELQDG